MDRKSAIAAAGTVALTLTATGVAIAANMGLLNQKTSSDLGQLSASVPPPASAEISTGAQPDPEVVTIYQDVPAPAWNAGAGQIPESRTEDSAGPSFNAANPAVPNPPADDHGDDGFEVENEDHEDEDHQTEDHSEEDHEFESESEDDD